MSVHRGRHRGDSVVISVVTTVEFSEIYGLSTRCGGDKD